MRLGTTIAAALIAIPINAFQTAPAGVEVFGPGVLSNGEVFRGTFAPDGRTFYFFKRTGEGESYRIFSSERTDGGWSNPGIVDLGGAHSDLYPAISRDGRRLVFSSYRAAPGAGAEKPNAHLWYSDRTAAGWSEPVYLARVNTRGHYHSWVEIAADGALYFRRTTPDWKENVTMRARRTGSEYAAPEPYVDVERWKGWRRDVRIAGGVPGPDGRLVFLDVATTHPRTGRPASDIWVSLRRGDTWTDPAPLGGGVNSDGFDVFPFTSPDGRDLFFVRDFAAFHRVPLAAALPSIEAGVEVRHVANSGMLVSVDGRRFLIDAPIRDGLPPYATSSTAERALLESAAAPYDDIDAILITHWHEDHFSAEAVAAHLARSPRTILISSPEVVDRVRKADASLPASRLRASLPAAGQAEAIDVAGVPVHALRIRHNPSRRVPDQHVGFLIAGTTSVLHVGDADPAANNFTVMQSLPPVDVAMLPFWYVSAAANRAFVAASIRPRRIVAMHVPPADANKVRAEIDAAGVASVLAAVPGSPLTLPAGQK